MSTSPAVRSIWPVMTVLFLAELVSSLEVSMLYAALPTAAREYGDLSRVTWLVTGYALVHACSAVLGSRLGDMYGRKRALIVVLLLCACGSLLSALAHDLLWITVGRMIQGATGAILPLAFGICREVTPANRTPFWIGVLTGAWAGSAAIGYILGGAFAEAGHWKALFWLTAVLPLATAALAWKVAPSGAAGAGGRIDVLGALMLVSGISLCLLAITTASTTGWLSMPVLGQMSGGLAILGAWLVVELRTPVPLVDVRQLANRQVGLANLAFAMLGLGGMQLAFLLMLLIQQPLASGIGFGVGATLAGLLKLPSNLISLVASPLSGFMAGRNGARAPLMLGGAAMTLAWVGMLLVNDELWHIVAASILAGVGSSMVLAAVPNLIVEVVSKDRTSEATGLPIVVRGVFSSIGAQIIAGFLASGSNGHPTERGYMLAMGFVSLASLAIVVIGLLLPRRPRPGRARAAGRNPQPRFERRSA